MLNNRNDEKIPSPNEPKKDEDKKQEKEDKDEKKALDSGTTLSENCYLYDPEKVSPGIGSIASLMYFSPNVPDGMGRIFPGLRDAGGCAVMLRSKDPAIMRSFHRHNQLVSEFHDLTKSLFGHKKGYLDRQMQGLIKDIFGNDEKAFNDHAVLKLQLQSDAREEAIRSFFIEKFPPQKNGAIAYRQWKEKKEEKEGEIEQEIITKCFNGDREAYLEHQRIQDVDQRVARYKSNFLEQDNLVPNQIRERIENKKKEIRENYKALLDNDPNYLSLKKKLLEITESKASEANNLMIKAVRDMFIILLRDCGVRQEDFSMFQLCISGSFGRGVGTPFSDLDLFIIYDYEIEETVMEKIKAALLKFESIAYNFTDYGIKQLVFDAAGINPVKVGGKVAEVIEQMSDFAGPLLNSARPLLGDATHLLPALRERFRDKDRDQDTKSTPSPYSILEKLESKSSKSPLNIKDDCLSLLTNILFAIKSSLSPHLDHIVDMDELITEFNKRGILNEQEAGLLRQIKNEMYECRVKMHCAVKKESDSLNPGDYTDRDVQNIIQEFKDRAEQNWLPHLNKLRESLMKPGTIEKIQNRIIPSYELKQMLLEFASLFEVFSSSDYFIRNYGGKYENKELNEIFIAQQNDIVARINDQKNEDQADWLIAEIALSKLSSLEDISFASYRLFLLFKKMENMLENKDFLALEQHLNRLLRKLSFSELHVINCCN